MSEIEVGPDTVFIPHDTMVGLANAIFAAVGCNEKEASDIATRLAGANLRGHDSHGVIRIPRYAQWARDGIQVCNKTVEHVLDQPGFAILDGGYGFGQSIGEQAVDIGIAKAKSQGVAVTALRNSGHLGRIGDWAERCAAENIVSIHFVNVRGSLLVAPYGGLDRRFGTSPFSAGIPVKGGEPVILDLATSTVAEGKALVALKGGKALPGDALIDSEGNLTSDPAPLYGEVPEGQYPDPNNGPGALTAFGAHKGSALNFLMEMMAGALGGSGTNGKVGETEKRRFCNGMFSFYVDAARFDGPNASGAGSMAEEILDFTAFVKSSRPTSEGGEVLVPGEKERRTMAERLETGLPLARQSWTDIVDTAKGLGITVEA
jgi:uncharacterized oxidoreductase